MKNLRAAIVGLLFVSTSLCCQERAAISTGNDSKHLKSNVAFSDGDTLRGVPASPAIVAPMQCTSDGRSFVSILQPPEFMDQLLLSISLSGNKDIHAFHTQQISDLYDIKQLGYFASGSTVSLLVHASGEDKRAKQTITTSSGSSWQRTGNVGQHHYYVASFDGEGKYKSSAQIDDSLRPHTIGVFPSGTMLISAFANEHSQLALLKADGDILRYIDLPKLYSAELDSRNSDSGMPAGTRMAREQFIAFQDSILIVQSGSALPVLQVSQSGSVRTIHVKLPDKLVVDTLLVDDGHLYARVTPKDAGSAMSRSIFEINPEDGSVIQEFALQGDTIADGVVCIHQGKFVSFRYGGEGILIPVLGIAER